MKEASGEASMTGITIALIAIVAVVATPIIRGVVNSTRNSACCQSMGGILFSAKSYFCANCHTLT